MSSPSPQNIYSALAQHIANPHSLSTEEQLFRDALKNTEVRRKKNGELSNVFDNLNHARSLDDVQYWIEREKESNTIWKHPVGKAWMEKFSKYAECIWYYKSVVDPVVALGSKVGAPIWSSVTFVINVFKDIGTTLDLSQDIERMLEASMEQVHEYLKRRVTPSPLLRKRLLSYYEAVLDFAIDAHHEFAKSLASTIFGLVHRKLLATLKRFYDKLRPIIADVNTAAQDDTLQGVHRQIATINDNILNHPLSLAPPVQLSLSTIHGLPQLSRSFTGQDQYVKSIWNLFSGAQGHAAQPPNSQRRAAVYGAGGLGKTQIIIKYAHDHVYSMVAPPIYDAAIWINATSEITIRSDITSFMEINGFREPLTDSQGNMRYAPFHARLQQHCKHWLLIFDNVNNYHDVRKAMPPGNSGHVLFSTRSKLIAGRLAPYSDPVEVLPMDSDTATNLVSRLTENSDYDQDKDTSVARAVSVFACGLPLLIEQIVNNAILGGQTVTETLKSLREKKNLLKQKNIDSLHEENLSLGAMAMQNFETLRAQSLFAEALYKILVYLEPSSMPLSLFQDVRGKFQDFLDRQSTYSRGAMDQKVGLIDREARLHVPESSPASEVGRRRLRLRSPFRRSKSASDVHTKDSLPVDDAKTSASFLQACGKGTALAELLENKPVLDSAILVLLNGSIIRQPNDHELWMHDLTSEVARALLTHEPTLFDPGLSLAAAAMVYLTFPTPWRHLGGARRITCQKYLPHAISCHTGLKMVGILNDSSIGPELGHLIASALHGLGTHYCDEDGSKFSDEQRQKNVARIIHYYRQAYAGYLAGWRRLKTDYGIDDKAIFLHIRTDRQQEASFNYYYIDRYAEGNERLGCNAPWRAIQTACKLAYWLGKDPATMDEAIAYIRVSLKFCTLAFGPNDSDTINMKSTLYRQLSSAQRWQEAYDVSIQGIKDLADWRPGDDMHNSKTTLEAVAGHLEASNFASRLSHCCMALSHDPSLSLAAIRTWASEAAMWIEIALRNVHQTYGEDECYARSLCRRYAEAHERAGRPRAAIYWYGRGVFCSLAYIMLEHQDWTGEPQAGAVTGGGEFLHEEAVSAFETAMIRLVGDCEGQLGKSDDLDVDLRRFLIAVKIKISVWRADREKNGVWDPEQEAADKRQREFEENERIIRLQEEKLYGRIPSLEEAIAEIDGEKEDLEATRIEMSLSKVQEEDVPSVDASQVATSEVQGEVESVPLPRHV